MNSALYNISRGSRFMMPKVFLLFAVLLRVAWCRPPFPALYTAPLPALSQDSTAPGPAAASARTPWPDDVVVWREDEPWNGSFYSFRFKTLLGIYRQERADLRLNAQGQKYLDVQGDYSYPTPDGVFHEVRYRAGEGGYSVTEAVEVTPNPGRNSYQQPQLNANSRRNNSILTKHLRNPNLNKGRIVFPNDLEEDRNGFQNKFGDNDSPTTTPSTSTDTANTTEFEDELVNRMGDVPPAVLASLLGR